MERVQGVLALVGLVAVGWFVWIIFGPSSDNDSAVDPTPSPTLSLNCENAMAQASGEEDSTKAQPLIEATTTACSGVDEWMTALRAYPAALGRTERSADETALVSLCGTEDVADTPVCSEAYERGLSPTPGP